MTINVGWIRDGSVFVVADAAITAQGPRAALRSSQTSFGERTIAAAGIAVEEAATKVFEVADRCVAAYSGSVSNALAALQRLRNLLLYGLSPPDALLAIHDLVQNCSLLIGTHDEMGARLWEVTSERIVERYEEPSLTIRGSARDDNLRFVTHTMHEVLRFPRADDVFVAAICGCQGRGQRVPTMQAGFGGTYWGMRVSSSGVSSCDDILFVLYERGPDNAAGIGSGGLRAVISGMRNQIAFTFEPSALSGRAFVTHVRPVADSEIRALFRSFELEVPQPRHIAFLERTIGAVVALTRQRSVDESEVAIRFDENGVHFNLGPWLVRQLKVVRDTPASSPEVPFAYAYVETQDRTTAPSLGDGMPRASSIRGTGHLSADRKGVQRDASVAEVSRKKKRKEQREKRRRQRQRKR